MSDTSAPFYPDFFPCPTWRYSELRSSFQRRTPMESGWKRQRKQWPQFGKAVDLTWEMPTTMFDNWSAFMEANGYDWFYMDLDDYGAGRVTELIRLSTDISFSYDSYDRITATATGEIYREGAILDPDCVPPYIIRDPYLVPGSGGSEPPAGQTCKTYLCSAYHDAIPTIASLKYWFPMGGSGSDADPTLPDVVLGDLSVKMGFSQLVPNEYLSFHAPILDTCDGTYGFQKLSPAGGSITDINALDWIPRISTGSTYSITVNPNGPQGGVSEPDYLNVVWADEGVTDEFQNLQVQLLYEHLAADKELYLKIAWTESDPDPVNETVEVATGLFLPYGETHNITVVIDTASLDSCDVTVYLDYASSFSQSVPMYSNGGGVRGDTPTGASILTQIESVYQDFLVFDTPLGGTDIAKLKEGYDRSHKTYTDPDVNCTPEIDYCDTYACDAYSKALDAVVDSHWLLQEGVVDNDTELDTNGVMPLTVTHTGAKGPALLADQCSPTTGSSEINWSTSGGRLSTDVTNPVPAGIRKIGGVGFFAGVIPSWDQEGRVMDVRWGDVNFVLTVQATGPGVFLNSRFGGPSHIFTGNAVDGKYIWANYYIYKVDTNTDDWSLDAEVFVDWVSVGTITLNHTYTTPDIDMDRLLIGEGGAGRWNVEHAAFASKRLGVDTIAGLADSLAQNNPSYVDPNPACVPGPAPAAEATEDDSLRVVGGGTGPLTYQWYEDAVLMPGETDHTLPGSSTDPAKIYAAEITGACGTILSNGISGAGEVPLPPPHEPDAYQNKIIEIANRYSRPVAMWILDDGSPGAQNPNPYGTITDYGTTLNQFALTFTGQQSGMLFGQPSMTDDGRASLIKYTPNAGAESCQLHEQNRDMTALYDADGSFTFSIVVSDIRQNNIIFKSVDQSTNQVFLRYVRSGDRLNFVYHGYSIYFSNAVPEGSSSQQLLTFTFDNSGAEPALSAFVDGNGTPPDGTDTGAQLAHVPQDYFLFAEGGEQTGGHMRAQYAWHLPGVVTIPEVTELWEAWEKTKNI